MSEQNSTKNKQEDNRADGTMLPYLKGRRKRTDDEDESDSSEPRRYKISGVSTEQLNNTIQAFQKEMQAMNKLLCCIKDEQDARFVQLERDVMEIKKEVKEVKKNSQEVEKAIDYLSGQYEEISRSNKEESERRKKEENRYDDLVRKNTFLLKCNKALEERIVHIEQKELERNIELVNVKKQEGEKLNEIVKKIANHLQVKSDDIDGAWRVPTEKKNPAPIIVTLRTKAARSEWLKAGKVMITNQTIYNDNDNKRIYINEHLTRPLRQLLWAVKSKLKEHYKYIWVQNSKILIRKDDKNNKIYQIRSETEIDQYIHLS